MKSICIKTNNSDVQNYLLDALNNINEEQVCFSCNKFKLYKNIIIHYTGDSIEIFITKLSTILSYLVIDKYEESILKRIISSNYFYFNTMEKQQVINICSEIFSEQNEFSLENRHQLLFNDFYNYIYSNKQLVLEGVINFRLKKYLNFLDSIIDIAVNKFIVEREYLEFISLLKVYINSQISSSNYVHLIYYDSHSILLDENKNIINIEEDIFNAKYLSDISFSSNDYALNSLLTILPKKIYLHLVNKTVDEFINTLQLIFENKIEMCTDCTICQIYRNNAKLIHKNK